jgi:hypothetical protein
VTGAEAARRAGYWRWLEAVRRDPRLGAYSIEAEADVHLLAGHSFDRPLASKRAGTLTFKDTAAALLLPGQPVPTTRAHCCRMLGGPTSSRSVHRAGASIEHGTSEAHI